MKIVYSIPDQENPFWKQVVSGIEKISKNAGASLEVLNAAHDENRQAEQLRAVLQKKPDAVLVSPVQTKTVAPVCKVIRENGVPIIAVDQNMSTDVTASVISGNLSGGSNAAKYLVKRLGPGKRLVYLLAETGLENVVLRRESFLNEVNRNKFIIVKKIQADSNRKKAREEMSAFLSERIAFDAIFAENDAMVLGAVDALSAREFRPWPIIVGFDGVSEAIEAIRDGKMEATVAQNPELLGEKAMEIVLKIVRRQPFKELTSVLPNLVTKNDLD